MPEGDTIFRAARTLHRALAGKTIVGFESVLPALNRVHEDTPLTNRTIEAVSASGKHLLIRISGGTVLRTHMRMNGSWHIYRPGEPWKRPRRDMRVLIATADFVAVGFSIPVAEFVRADRLHRHEGLRRLGPDLLSDGFDEEDALRRVRARSTHQIGEVLLDQQVVAGIGNVYRSEVLFSCRVNPFLPVARLTDDTIRRLVRTARRLLRVNVLPNLPPMTTYAARRTTGRDNPSERLWVYGRGARPCRRCGAAIQSRRSGPGARLTYWCPACQPEPQAGPGEPRNG